MRFTKMHGAGNSFFLMENLHGELQGEDLQSLALRLCSAENGPGADGLIVLAPAQRDEDFSMLFYNSDGSRGEMCGNGARCVARYGVERGIVRDPAHIVFRATAGLIYARRIDETQYEVRLNNPSVIDLHRPVSDGERVFDSAYVELGEPGIPHAVIETPEEDFCDLNALRARGRALRHSPVYPRGANVSFVSVTSPQSVRALTYERGVEDFTLACGTGSGSIVLTMLLRGRLAGDRATVDMPGGRLSVLLTREGRTARNILLTGPTAVVETGTFFPEG